MGSLTRGSAGNASGPGAVIIFAYDMRNKGDQAIAVAEQALLGRLGFEQVSVSMTCYQESADELPSWNIYPPLVLFRRRRLGRGVLVGIAGAIFAIATTAWQAAILPLKLWRPVGRNKELLRKIKSSELVLITGGGFINDSLSYSSLKRHMRAVYVVELCLMAYEVWLLRRLVPVNIVVMPHSLGPFSTRLGRAAASIMLTSCDKVFARDEKSLVDARVLAKNVESAPDIALTMKPPRRRPIPGSLAVCPKSFIAADRESYVEAHARALDAFIKATGAKAYFIPSNITHGARYDDDLATCLAIKGRMTSAGEVDIVETGRAEEFLEWLGKMEMTLSSRLHPAVLSAVAGTPFASLVCEYKQDGFAAQMGLSGYCLPMRELSAASLEEVLLRCWSRRLALSPGLKERAREAGRDCLERVTPALGRAPRSLRAC